MTPLLRTVALSLAWGIMMAFSAAWSLAVDFERVPDGQFLTLAALYFAGACAAVPAAIPLTSRADK